MAGKKILILFLFTPYLLLAEISWLKIDWNKEECGSSCQKTLDLNLKRYNPIAEYDLNAPFGNLTVYLKPNISFDIIQFQQQLKIAGVFANIIRVKVRGTVSKDGADYVVTSLGDNTKFYLKSSHLIKVPKGWQQNGNIVVKSEKQQHPTTAGTEMVEIESNQLSDHMLNPQTKKELQKAIDNYNIVEVEGPLFLPYLFTRELYLIANNIQYLR